MDGWAIQVYATNLGSSHYRSHDEQDWGLDEAETRAHELLTSRRLEYVALVNGAASIHEFRMWSDGADRGRWDNFPHGDIRWSPWYVDAEINGHRWRYRPLADLHSYDEAADAARGAMELEEVTRVWVGASNGDEEFESHKAD